MDIALYIDEPSKNDFGYNDTLSYEEIISIGSKNKLTFPSISRASLSTTLQSKPLTGSTTTKRQKEYRNKHSLSTHSSTPLMPSGIGIISTAKTVSPSTSSSYRLRLAMTGWRRY